MERGIKLPLSSSEWGFRGENYLLVIGINKYSSWKPLNNAVKDVRDITRLLTERYQFDPSHVMSLTDEEATEDNIRQKLLQVRRTITQEDNLIVFFSGHGYYDSDLDEGYWVPSNARKDNPSDYISNSDVLKWIRSVKTHHTLMLVDSCFSGTLVSQSRGEVLSEKYSSCRIFASGRKELVDDGTPGTNSPFAQAILSRLSHNTDRVLRASELIQNVEKIVESHGGQVPIEGRIKDAGDEGGEFVFHLKITEEEIWSSIVTANSVEEYSKYIEYYPDGPHALEARTKLSKLTDEDDWKLAKELSSPGSLTQYLEKHPQGIYNDEALRKLEELEENDAWQLAKTRNSISAFMDYLRKYPSGRFESVARKNLDGLKQSLKQHEQQLVQDELEGINDTTEKLSDNKEQFKKLINEAEGLYAQMAYEKCVARYAQALLIQEKHFVPDRKFIEQRISSAKSRIGYVEFLEDGIKAVTDGNYTLALEFFKKAKSIDDTPKIREWIKHAEIKQSGGMYNPDKTIPPSLPLGPNKKTSSALLKALFLIGFFVLVIVVLITYSLQRSAKNFENAYNSKLQEDTSKEIPEAYSSPVQEKMATEYTSKSNNPSATAADFVPGSWNVEDRVIAGVSYAKMQALVPASWAFNENGYVTYFAGGYTYTGTWYLSGFSLSVNLSTLGSISGLISSIDDKNMIWVTNEFLINTYVPVTNYLSHIK